MSENTDPRALQTRAKLVAAMRAMASPESAGLPSVASVAERAGVARSAFYSHFTGLDDLAEYVLETDLRTLAAADEPVRSDPSVSPSAATRRVVQQMVQTLLGHRDLYTWLFLHGGDAALQRVRDVLSDTVRRNVIATGLDRDVTVAEIEVSAAYGAGGFVNTMTAYLRGDIDLPPDELTDLIVELSPPLYRDR